MYTVAVKRNLIARHFLIGGDWGPENEMHSHHYQVEVLLEGPFLNEHGYLVDILDVEANLEEIITVYEDRTLNELPEFEGLNPSIEHFCRIICHSLSTRLHAPNVTALTVRIWENEVAWASYRVEIET